MFSRNPISTGCWLSNASPAKSHKAKLIDPRTIGTGERNGKPKMGIKLDSNVKWEAYSF
jgi:hypothetical protein